MAVEPGIGFQLLIIQAMPDHLVMRSLQAGG